VAKSERTTALMVNIIEEFGMEAMGRSGSVPGMVMVVAGGIDVEMVLRRLDSSSV
jgi:hypothetical protein